MKGSYSSLSMFKISDQHSENVRHRNDLTKLFPLGLGVNLILALPSLGQVSV